jgi:hypothetical protein
MHRQLSGCCRHSVDAAVKVFRTEGLKAYWAGYGAVPREQLFTYQVLTLLALQTILRDIPFACIYFLSYEGLKDLQRRAMSALTLAPGLCS